MSRQEQFRASRRRFLTFAAASGAALVGSSSAMENPVVEEKKESTEPPFLVTPPVLQCPTEDSMAVVWTVNRSAAGYVEFGTEKDRIDQTAHGEVFGLKPYHERYLQLRIEGLKPNTRYYYRTVTCSFDYKTSYKFNRGEPVYSEIYSFETPGPGKTAATFSVMNDTHNNQKTLKLLTDRLARINSDYTIWNGDLVDGYSSDQIAVDAILYPAQSAFATEHPLLFVPGNHDHRGVWARNLPLAAPTWRPKAISDLNLGRNFVVRSGPLAMIGLDTGEDKPDESPEFGGMVHFGPYRIAQRNWLERALKSQEVASAPFVVAFCHIPIFDSRPDANGGDVMVRWAQFQRQASELWGPLLTQHGVQLVVAAHMHRFRYDEPTSNRTWGQLVGGGHSPKGEITVIHAKAENDVMEVVVDELNQDKELGRWTFKKRNIS